MEQRSNYWLRRPVRRRSFVQGSAFGAAALGAALVVGCGDDDDDTGATASPAATSPGTTPAAAEPVRGGILQKSRIDDMAFDHLSLFSSVASSFATVVYGGLLTHKPSPDPTKVNSFEITGNIVNKWEQPDNLTYTMHIHPDAKYHNKPPVDGRAQTANDVLQSYNKFVSSPTNSYRTQFDIVDGAPTVLDDKTIQFKTKEPFAPFLTALMAYRQFFYVYPAELVEKDELRSTNPVGSGPFMFKTRQAGSYWEFERNPDYFLKDEQGRQLPFLDGVRYNVIPEPAQVLAQFIAGNLDEANVTSDNIDQVKSQVKDVTTVQVPTAAKMNIVPQLRSGPLQDPRLRQAVAMAVDRDAIIAAISKGQGGWNNFAGFAEGKWYLDPRSPNAGAGGQYLKYNEAEAKKLISTIGVTGDLQFSYPNNGYGEPFNSICTIVIDFLKRAGLKVQPVTLDYRTQYIAAGGKGAFFGDFKDFLGGFQPTYPHAYLNFSNILKTKGPHNSEGASDPKLDDLIAALGREFDTEAAYQKAYDVQKYALEQLYLIPTAGGVSHQVWQPNVHNYALNAAYSDEEIKTVWKAKA